MPTLVHFRMQVAEDPTRPGYVARSTPLTVYSTDDLNNTTPLALFDPNGLSIGNPITTTAEGLLPPLAVYDLFQVKLVDADGHATVIESVEGMRDEVNASRAAAQDAAAQAQQATALVSAPTSDIVVQLLSDPQSAVRQLLDATYATGTNTGGTGGGTLTDVDNDGVFEQGANPVLIDPDNDGIFQIVSA